MDVYRLWNPDTNECWVSHDVHFDNTCFPLKKLDTFGGGQLNSAPPTVLPVGVVGNDPTRLSLSLISILTSSCLPCPQLLYVPLSWTCQTLTPSWKLTRFVLRTSWRTSLCPRDPLCPQRRGKHRHRCVGTRVLLHLSFPLCVLRLLSQLAFARAHLILWTFSLRLRTCTLWIMWIPTQTPLLLAQNPLMTLWLCWRTLSAPLTRTSLSYRQQVTKCWDMISHLNS